MRKWETRVQINKERLQLQHEQELRNRGRGGWSEALTCLHLWTSQRERRCSSSGPYRPNQELNMCVWEFTLLVLSSVLCCTQCPACVRAHKQAQSHTSNIFIRRRRQRPKETQRTKIKTAEVKMRKTNKRRCYTNVLWSGWKLVVFKSEDMNN